MEEPVRRARLAMELMEKLRRQEQTDAQYLLPVVLLERESSEQKKENQSMEKNRIVLQGDLEQAFRDVGLQAGDTVIVHCSLSSLGYVCGGAQSIIEALIQTVGQEGTILMPAQSWKNLDPTAGVHWQADAADWDRIRENWPAYDKNITPTNTMGAVAEMFRQWPGAIRSDHPARSFAARGKYAQHLMENHDLRDIFGDTSPLGKLYGLNGKVLLIGVGHDKNTSIHLADARAEYPSKHLSVESSAMMVDGKRQWVSYETLYVDGEDFLEIGQAFEQVRPVQQTTAGSARIKCMNMKELVDFAIDWIQQNRTPKEENP